MWLSPMYMQSSSAHHTSFISNAVFVFHLYYWHFGRQGDVILPDFPGFVLFSFLLHFTLSLSLFVYVSKVRFLINMMEQACHLTFIVNNFASKPMFRLLLLCCVYFFFALRPQSLSIRSIENE